MDDHELAERAHALPDIFANRLEPADLDAVREYAEAGEWGEEIDLLLASLRETQRSVTAVSAPNWSRCWRPWASRPIPFPRSVSGGNGDARRAASRAVLTSGGSGLRASRRVTPETWRIRGASQSAGPGFGPGLLSIAAQVLLLIQDCTGMLLMSHFPEHGRQLFVRLRPKILTPPRGVLARQPVETACRVDRAGEEAFICKAVEQEIAGAWPAFLFIDDDASLRAAQT